MGLAGALGNEGGGNSSHSFSRRGQAVQERGHRDPSLREKKQSCSGAHLKRPCKTLLLPLPLKPLCTPPSLP